MASGRMFSGKRLAMSGFTVLLVAAFGTGCKGFWTGNTLQSIAVQPSTINMQVNDQQQFSAWGTYQDGSRSQISSGLVWSSSDPSVSITSGGLATALTVTSAAVTITGSAQGYSGTGTVNVIGNVTSMTVNPTTANMTENATATPFTFTGSPGPPTYITVDNGGTLTITQGSGTSTSAFTCSVGTDAKGNPAELCQATTGASGQNPWTIQMSYPTPSGGTTMVSATATVSGP
jgi:hypothetical protein